MIKIRPFTSREKCFMFIITLLAALLLAGWQPTQAARDQYTQYSDRQLYDRAERYSQQGNIVAASIYLFAYIQRNPSDYANNVGNYRAKIDQVYGNWMDTALEYQSRAREASMHIASCDQYPCKNGESESRGIYAKVFPSEMVRVCQNKNYLGKCVYIAMGEYTQLGMWNDSISSVEVGSKVQVLLCVHSLDLAGNCLTLTQSDSDLKSNWLPGKNYTLDNNISSIRVTYRDGKGLTLP